MRVPHERNSLVYWVSWRMAARSERKAQPPRSSSVAARDSRRDMQDGRLECGEHAQAGALPERDEAHCGGDQVDGEGLEVRGCGYVFTNAVTAREGAHRHGIGDAFRQFRRMPSRGCSDECGALIQRLDSTLARRRNRGGEVVQGCVSHPRRGGRGEAVSRRYGRNHAATHRQARCAVCRRPICRRIPRPIPDRANKRRRQ